MSSYLVESYLARSGASELPRIVARARQATEGMTFEGTPVRYLRSTFVVDDEVCFHFFEGPSAEAIRAAAQRADIAPDRISEAVDGPFDGDPKQPSSTDQREDLDGNA